MIKLSNVEKVYESKAGNTWVLRRINLDIREGEFVTIMGPSGAGKSTLMGIIGMLDGAWRGEYSLDEHAVHRLDSRRRVELHKQYVGFVFQQYHLIDDLTVAENLDLPLSYWNIRKAERQALVADILDRFQIVGKKELFPNQLSGGQQQLVAVARAVIDLGGLRVNLIGGGQPEQLRGWTFTETDDASSQPVVIINETMAKKYWPKGDEIGVRVDPLVALRYE